MSNYANLYSVTLHYGGPEEGGWWYSCYTPLRSIRLRGSQKGSRLLRSFNRVRELFGFPTTRSALHYNRTRRNPHSTVLLRSGRSDASAADCRIKGSRWWVSYGDCSSTRGTETLLTCEPHPARAYPPNKPAYE